MRVPLVVIQRQLGHADLAITSLGRDGARCRRYRRSVSSSRPPNRTCPFLSIRLSTGHAMVDHGIQTQRRSGGGPSGGGPACSGCRPRRGDVVAAIAILGHRHLVGPREPRAFAAGPVVPPAPSPDLFPGQPRVLFAQPSDHLPPQVVAEISEAAAACGVAVVVSPTPEDWV